MRGEAAPCPVYAPFVGKVVPDGGRVFLRRVDSGRTLSVAYGDSCSPFCRLSATSSPGRGKSFHSGRALGRTGRFRPHRSTAGRRQPISGKLSVLAKASPFRERWHGEAVTERVSSGTNPLSLAALDSSPEGRALGRTGEFRPYSSTAERIQLLSCKLFALAKASPFRERWHSEAVTERVAFRLTAAFGKRFSHGPAERPSSLESRY